MNKLWRTLAALGIIAVTIILFTGLAGMAWHAMVYVATSGGVA